MTSLEERTRLSQALAEIDLRIHSKRSIDEIMQAALDGFVEAIRADAGDIKLIEGDEWVVRFEHGFGAQEVGLRLSVPEAPVAARVARQRKPVLIEDYLAEPESFYVGFPRRHHLRATLAMPLVIREEIVGCLFAWMRTQPRRFTPGEVDFARRMATSLALALDNARLFEGEREARERAEAAETRLAEELERTRVLLRASDELSTASDSNELLARLASIVLDATGLDRAFINLVDTKTGLLTPKVATGGLKTPGGTRIRFEELSETSRQAIAAKKTVILDYERSDIPEKDRAIARANSARLVLFVPLIHQGEVIGHITLDQAGERHAFTAQQIRVVDSIAAQAAVALQNIRSFERDHRIAETLQQAILQPPENIPGLEVAYRYQPASAAANVGGDFFDVFDLGAGRVALAVGDVAGKGIASARLTTLMRDGMRAYLLEDSEPASVLERLNELAFRFTPTEKFATIFLGVLDVPTGGLRYCNAGHPPAVIAGPVGPRTLESSAGLIGAFAGTEFTALETVLSKGEVLCLLTDGVTEARRESEMFGEAGVLDALQRLQGTRTAELADALLDEVLSFSGGYLRDDVVVLCVSRSESG